MAFQQVWKPRLTGGHDSQFNVQSALIRRPFIRSIELNHATRTLFKTYCLSFSRKHKLAALPNFCQNFTRIIKYLLCGSRERLRLGQTRALGKELIFSRLGVE
jgi:hypothetical protein